MLTPEQLVSPVPEYKQPGEVIPFTVKFGTMLKTGETISGTPVFTASELTAPLADGGVHAADATSALAQGSVVPDGTDYTQLIRAGTHGKNYVLRLTATTSLGQVRYGVLEIAVRQVPVGAA